MINYEDELNGAQLDAVRYLDGPSLVIAGAGSGKTRVLTYKIAYLLENGFEPWSILALTFTNKAANEMKERIAARVGQRAASMLWMGTFHSVFSKILRREAHHIGYDPQFTIYDQSDSRSLVKSIIKDLQLDAVRYLDGPSLVIAGAGSGKTRVLTYKIAYLLENGFEPWSILALTFTNKAANEMKERIAARVGQRAASMLWMGTFHSVFSKILRREAHHIGYDPQFTIYDQSDSRSLVKSIIKDLQLDDKLYKPNAVAERISSAKSNLISPSDYENDQGLRNDDKRARIPAVYEIYKRYAERCRLANAMDFDDLLVNTYRLFKDLPEVRRQYVERFRYVLVDEFQDTNYVQACIVWQLTQERKAVCVVGDDAQSIYSFRGANIGNILGFAERYGGAQIFKLEQNYRSTRMIVNAANSLIAKNSEQIKKNVYSERGEGSPLELYPAYSDLEEVEIVANKIADLRRREGLQFRDFAILYRTNAQSRVFEEAFRRRAFPYRIFGGLSFYQRKEVKDVIAYFRLICNKDDEEAFKRIINYPARGIGDK
ncbi:MAG: UvrD-helicase domain-containing protein, partial [Bacteroidaceae bacterium]|nr:UvrD-helicase domain-containing protein [Bacteroidaceae bacterium]